MKMHKQAKRYNLQSFVSCDHIRKFKTKSSKTINDQYQLTNAMKQLDDRLIGKRTK